MAMAVAVLLNFRPHAPHIVAPGSTGAACPAAASAKILDLLKQFRILKLVRK